MTTTSQKLLSLCLVAAGALAAHQTKAEVLTQDAALKLITKSGCTTCHAIDQAKLGPAYKDVAARYASPSAEVKAYLKGQAPLEYLMTKVRTGTKVGINKNWIKTKEGRPYAMMTPNPVTKISDADLKALLQFILALK